MLLHILTAVTERELQSRLCQLLEKPDTIVETVKDYSRFWKKISRRTCDLVVLSRYLIQDKDIKKIQNIRQLPEAPLIVVLSEEEDEEERLRPIQNGCHSELDNRHTIPGFDITSPYSTCLFQPILDYGKLFRFSSGTPHLFTSLSFRHALLSLKVQTKPPT